MIFCLSPKNTLSPLKKLLLQKYKPLCLLLTNSNSASLKPKSKIDKVIAGIKAIKAFAEENGRFYVKNIIKEDNNLLEKVIFN